MGCVQSYFRKAHSAGLSPSSTQASEKQPLPPDEELLDKDLVIVDADEVKLALQQDTDSPTKENKEVKDVTEAEPSKEVQKVETTEIEGEDVLKSKEESDNDKLSTDEVDTSKGDKITPETIATAETDNFTVTIVGEVTKVEREKADEVNRTQIEQQESKAEIPTPATAEAVNIIEVQNEISHAAEDQEQNEEKASDEISQQGIHDTTAESPTEIEQENHPTTIRAQNESNGDIQTYPPVPAEVVVVSQDETESQEPITSPETGESRTSGAPTPTTILLLTPSNELSPSPTIVSPETGEAHATTPSITVSPAPDVTPTSSDDEFDLPSPPPEVSASQSTPPSASESATQQPDSSDIEIGGQESSSRGDVEYPASPVAVSQSEPTRQSSASVVTNDSRADSGMQESVQARAGSEAESIADEEVLGAAATKIQAGFRGYKTRQDLKTVSDEISNDDITSAKEDSGMPKNVDLSPQEEKARLELSATTIQATYRGYKTRQQLKSGDRKSSSREPSPSPENATDNKVPVELVGHSRPEVESTLQNSIKTISTNSENSEECQEGLKDASLKTAEEEIAAATTIQANFRGFQTRQQLKSRPEGEVEEETKPNENEKDERNITTQDGSEMETAATTIQSAFRGFQVRQQLKENTDEDERGDKIVSATDEVKSASAVSFALESVPTISPTFTQGETDNTHHREDIATQSSQEKSKSTEEHVDKSQVSQLESQKSIKTSVEVHVSSNDLETEKMATAPQDVQRPEKSQEQPLITDAKKQIPSDSTVDDKVPSQKDVNNVLNAEVLETAATTIQATFRGYKARKDQNAEHSDPETGVVSEVEASKIVGGASENKSDQTRKLVTEESIKEKNGGSEPTPEVVEEKQDVVSSTIISDVEMKHQEVSKREVSVSTSGEKEITAEVHADEEKRDNIKTEADILTDKETEPKMPVSVKHIEENIQESKNDVSKEKTSAAETQIGADCVPPLEDIIKSLTASPQPLVEPADLSEGSVPPPEDVLPEMTLSSQVSLTGSLPEPATPPVPPLEDAMTLPLSPCSSPVSTSTLPVSSNEDTLVSLLPVATGSLLALEDELPPPPSLTDSLPDLAAAPDLPTDDAFLPPPPPLDNDNSLTDVSLVTDTASEVGDALPRSPETGEQRKIRSETYDAVDLATLQRPQECAELPHQKLGDPDVADSAATKIQAGVRGFIARRQVQRMRTDQPPNTKGEMAVSLDSALPKASDVSKLAETRSAEQMEEDCAVWDTLRNEMEEAATRIQSNYRGYRTRQKLTRGDAVRAATTSTSDSGGSQDQTGVLHTGELHDAVLPPLPPKQNGS